MNVMVCFMCGLNLIEDVLTVCCLYCLCLESWDVISACLVTPLSLSAVSVSGDGEQSGARGASQEVLSSQSSLFSPNTDWQPATAARLSLAACKL